MMVYSLSIVFCLRPFFYAFLKLVNLYTLIRQCQSLGGVGLCVNQHLNPFLICYYLAVFDLYESLHDFLEFN